MPTRLSFIRCLAIKFAVCLLSSQLRWYCCLVTESHWYSAFTGQLVSPSSSFTPHRLATVFWQRCTLWCQRLIFRLGEWTFSKLGSTLWWGRCAGSFGCRIWLRGMSSWGFHIWSVLARLFGRRGGSAVYRLRYPYTPFTVLFAWAKGGRECR